MEPLKKFNQFNENMNEDHMDIEHHGEEHYMFFENLKTIKRCVDELLQLDETEVDEILASGHDWAADHIAVAKVDVEQVYDFLLNNADEDMEMHDDIEMHDMSHLSDMSMEDEMPEMGEEDEYDEE